MLLDYTLAVNHARHRQEQIARQVSDSQVTTQGRGLAATGRRRRRRRRS